MKDYGMSLDEYMNAVLLDGISRLAGEAEDYPGYFGFEVIQNVPYINYPGLTDEQNSFAQAMAKQVLIVSKRENQFKEVAITYNLNNPDDYIVTKGSDNMVFYKDDKDVENLLNKSEPMMIVSLHNHPNNSEISFADLSIFCLSDQIKLMSIVNTRGEVSFLERTKNINLMPVMLSSLSKFAPDIRQRTIINPQKDVVELISPNECSQIRNNLLESIQKCGIIYHEQVSKGIDLDFKIEKPLEEEYYPESIESEIERHKPQGLDCINTKLNEIDYPIR